ncbi:MAG TPA: D-alanyl-D-alanine carboxypeptidase/D-alanyl-D-alanine-endopeptidase [Patescibacteria group bacterium]|nr:D-alanyl-D-alanine carboxypeptidase/D-alanyl-D-alanine-endopeptidase [Patescibacteria group bacterium]
MNLRRFLLKNTFLIFAGLAISWQEGAAAQVLKERPISRADTIKPVERRIPPRPSPIRELQSDIDGLLANPDFSNAFIGMAVQSIESGEYMYRRNETKNFLPASALKLLTTAAALEYLGPDFRYTTRVFLDGELQPSGEFIGNIIVRAAGDPSMSSYFYTDPTDILEAFASKLDSVGIRSIRGNIIGDDSYFDRVHLGPGWAWDDEIYPYSAQINALSFNDNKVDITIIPGKAAGDPAKVLMNPDISYVRILNNVYTAQPNEVTEIIPLRESHSNVIEINGRIAMDSLGTQKPYSLSLTIDNPTLFFLSLLKQSLEKRGIRFRGALLDVDDWNERIVYNELTPVAQHVSPTLGEIVKVTNKFSHNLCAEMILKTVGKESSGQGSFVKGTDQLKRFASTIGISPDHIALADGSGLSRMNAITPQQFVTLLSSMYRSANRKEFMASLAVPGEPGTLRGRMTRSRAEKSVIAKTGSLNNISTLSGYVTTRDNETLAVAIMLNNYTVPDSMARNLQDLLCMRLASFTRKQ